MNRMNRSFILDYHVRSRRRGGRRFSSIACDGCHYSLGNQQLREGFQSVNTCVLVRDSGDFVIVVCVEELGDEMILLQFVKCRLGSHNGQQEIPASEATRLLSCSCQCSDGQKSDIFTFFAVSSAVYVFYVTSLVTHF